MIDFTLLYEAVDQSINGIIITDNLQPDNPIIYCNAAFEKLSGYERHEIIGHNCRFLQAEDRHQPQRVELKSAVQRGEAITVDIRNYKKDGSLFWNELHVSPIKNKDGTVTHFVGVQNDISEKRGLIDDLLRSNKEMEAKVAERTRIWRDERDFTQSILSTVRESLIVLDFGLKVLSVNEHFLRTFKVSQSETEGQQLYDLGNGQWNIPALRNMLEQILPTNNPVLDFEVSHDFPHIGKKIMLLNAYRIELDGQYRNRILLAIEDITERRSIEARKDDFLSIASHELKTPLTTIKGYIQMLTRQIPENASEHFRELIDKANASVARLNNLISELLDVSRIQSGNIELHLAPFDFDRMIRETVEGMQAACTTHRIVLTGDIRQTVCGDETHLAQVLTNLLSNAIKYSPDAEQVHVHAATLSNYVKVSVTDSGMGIRSDEQSKIFERFYRVGENQRRFPGMGIGLYICDQIIKNHKGSIWVESNPKTGSTFSFTIPINNTLK